MAEYLTNSIDIFESRRRFVDNWEHIISKYDREFPESDVVDLHHGVIVDRGHLSNPEFPGLSVGKAPLKETRRRARKQIPCQRLAETMVSGVASRFDASVVMSHEEFVHSVIESEKSNHDPETDGETIDTSSSDSWSDLDENSPHKPPLVRSPDKPRPSDRGSGNADAHKNVKFRQVNDFAINPKKIRGLSKFNENDFREDYEDSFNDENALLANTPETHSGRKRKKFGPPNFLSPSQSVRPVVQKKKSYRTVDSSSDTILSLERTSNTRRSGMLEYSPKNVPSMDVSNVLLDDCVQYYDRDCTQKRIRSTRPLRRIDNDVNCTYTVTRSPTAHHDVRPKSVPVSPRLKSEKYSPSLRRIRRRNDVLLSDPSKLIDKLYLEAIKAQSPKNEVGRRKELFGVAKESNRLDSSDFASADVVDGEDLRSVSEEHDLNHFDSLDRRPVYSTPKKSWLATPPRKTYWPSPSKSDEDSVLLVGGGSQSDGIELASSYSDSSIMVLEESHESALNPKPERERSREKIANDPREEELAKMFALAHHQVSSQSRQLSPQSKVRSWLTQIEVHSPKNPKTTIGSPSGLMSRLTLNPVNDDVLAEDASIRPFQSCKAIRKPSAKPLRSARAKLISTGPSEGVWTMNREDAFNSQPPIETSTPKRSAAKTPSMRLFSPSHKPRDLPFHLPTSSSRSCREQVKVLSTEQTTPRLSRDKRLLLDSPISRNTCNARNTDKSVNREIYHLDRNQFKTNPGGSLNFRKGQGGQKHTNVSPLTRKRRGFSPSDVTPKKVLIDSDSEWTVKAEARVTPDRKGVFIPKARVQPMKHDPIPCGGTVCDKSFCFACSSYEKV